ncbi:MAG: OpgC domain-containing protein, partial [Panacagrimonas sp.]
MNVQATDPGRNDGLDALRGLLLVLMTLTHMPTTLQVALGQPLGHVSAAEGFVLLSAFLAGQVYLRRGIRQGFEGMRKALWARASTVYRHHLGLFAFGISMVLVLGMVNGRDAVTNLFTQYLAHPVASASAALLFAYQPPLLDILPMYVLFLLLTPWVLEGARRHGWTIPLAVSVAIWIAGLLGLRSGFYDLALAWTGIPMAATGSFNVFAWQFMWVVGLWLGT